MDANKPSVWARIKVFLRGLKESLMKFLDSVIAKLNLEPVQGGGIFSRIWRIMDRFRSGSLFVIALGAILLTIFFGGAFLLKAAFAMFLVFTGLFIILMQLKDETRKKLVATLVKYRLFADVTATAVGLLAVFGAFFGVTTSFIWAFSLIGVSAMLSILDWYGRSMWGPDFKDHAWQPSMTEESELAPTVA